MSNKELIDELRKLPMDLDIVIDIHYPVILHRIEVKQVGDEWGHEVLLLKIE